MMRTYIPVIYLLTLFTCLLGQVSTSEHPYVWADAKRFAQLREQVRSPIFQMRYQRIINWADAAMSKPVKGYKISSFEAEGIATACAFAYQMTGKKAYAERAKKEVWAMLKEQRWISPKHASFTKGAGLGHGHCSMCCATVYDWCVDTFTDAERKKFISNVERLSFAYYLKSIEHKDYWVDNMVTNWAGTCHGGAGCLALALINESEMAKEVASKSWKHIEAFLRGVHLQDGGGHEGVMYHHYGLSYAHVAADAFSNYYQDDNGLYEALNKKAVGYWSVYMYAPDKKYANFNDFHEGFLTGMFDMAGRGKANHYFAELFALYESKVPGGDPFLLWAADHAHGQWTYGRTAPWWLLWRRPQVKSTDKRFSLDDCVLFREAGQSVWKSGPWWLALNNGWTSNRSHWNKDLGTFILCLGDQRVVRDQGYGKQETKDHSCLLINGTGQETNVAADIIVHGKDKEQDVYYAVSDLSACYRQSSLRRYLRHVIILKQRYVLVIDDIEGQGELALEQQFQLAHKASIVQGNKQVVQIAMPQQPLYMSAVSRPQTTWHAASAAQPRLVQKTTTKTRAQMVTVFSPSMKETYDWEKNTLSVGAYELTFKPSKRGLLLYACNDERLNFGDHTQRSFTVYRKDEAKKTVHASKNKKLNKGKHKKDKKQRSDKDQSVTASKTKKQQLDLSAWDADLIRQVNALLQQGAVLEFRCSLFKSNATIKSADQSRVTLKTRDMSMPLNWSRLKLLDKASMAGALAQQKNKFGTDEALNNALATVYYKAAGELMRANKYAAKVGDYNQRIKETLER